MSKDPSASTFPLVSPQWLKGRLDDPAVVVLDATYHLPNVERDAKAEFEVERIPGARFFDIDAVKDLTDPLPHMVPAPDAFAAAASSLGISNDTHVVCYDSYGLFSAARPWWMFRLFGHDRVSVLDGGLPGWKAAGLSVESGAADAPPSPGDFKASFRPDLVWSTQDVLTNIQSESRVVVDARAAGRYAGTAPEPRPELRSGHIPGSLNLPFNWLVDPDTGRVKDAKTIEALFDKAGFALGRDKAAFSCGSGVTACVLALGLHLLGDDKAAVYDGSWSAWGSDPVLPIENPNAG